MGAAISGMLSTALVGVFYAAWRLGGLPFVPFDVFDWTTRKLPGSVVTFGIDTLVRVVRALDLGATAEAAKAAEHGMAIAGMLVTCAVTGSVVFAVARAGRRDRAIPIGLAAGAALGAPVLLISRSVGQTATAAPWLNAAWVLGLFLLWGAALGWACRRLSADAVSADRPSVGRLNRRQFLISLGGATAVITVAGAVVGKLAGGARVRRVEGEHWSVTHALPNADATLAPAPGTRPEFTPLDDHYRIDINTISPAIDEADWRLRISGLVERPLSLTLADLRTYPPLDQFITLSCISNPVAGDLISTQRWTGVSLQRLLADWRLRPEATHLKLSAADGFYEIVALETIAADERVMLSYAWDGVPLRVEHGFPLRIYIPNVHGMKQPKWLESIEAIDRWEAGYWVERGWDREARMKATSVIDTVAMDMMIAQADERTLIPVGGIAHAGARGISRVEVRVDDGEWRAAQLREPLSGTTWVIWRYDWGFQPGRHTFTVRCYDGAGALQIAEEAPPHPSGASGLHSESIRL